MCPADHTPPPTLAQRQQALLQRSALLRFEISEQCRELGESFVVADQTYAGWLWLKSHPLWALAAMLLVTARRPKQLLRWLPRLWWAWGLLKKFRVWMKQAP